MRAGAAALGLLTHALLNWSIRRLQRQADDALPLRRTLLDRLPGPFRILLPTLFAYGALPAVRPQLPAGAETALDGGLHVLLVLATTWLLIAALVAGEEAVAAFYTTDTPDNLKARKIVTQVRILRRIVTAIIIVLATGLILLRYEPFRQLGTGILASAGIVGIVVGIAAQNTLSDLTDPWTSSSITFSERWGPWLDASRDGFQPLLHGSVSPAFRLPSPSRFGRTMW